MKKSNEEKPMESKLISTKKYTGQNMVYKIREDLISTFDAYKSDQLCVLDDLFHDTDSPREEIRYYRMALKTLSFMREKINQRITGFIKECGWLHMTDYRILKYLMILLVPIDERTSEEAFILSCEDGKEFSTEELMAIRHSTKLAYATILNRLYEWYRHELTETYAGGKGWEQ